MVEIKTGLVWSGLLGTSIAAVSFAAKTSHTVAASFILAILPFLVFGALTVLESSGNQAKRTAARPEQRAVLRVSRSVYERLDPDVLQLFLSERDFTSSDYERLMQLESFNEKKKSEGASEACIRRLPLVAVSDQMIRASKNPCCSICLVNFEVNTQVRMMPCFHHFHPGCIDPWLKDKAQCPICKCSVVGDGIPTSA